MAKAIGFPENLIGLPHVLAPFSQVNEESKPNASVHESIGRFWISDPTNSETWIMYPLKTFEQNRTGNPYALRMDNYSQNAHTIQLDYTEGYSTMTSDGYQSFMILPDSDFFWGPFNQSLVHLTRQQARAVFPFANKFYFLDNTKHSRNVIRKIQFGG